MKFGDFIGLLFALTVFILVSLKGKKNQTQVASSKNRPSDSGYKDPLYEELKQLLGVDGEKSSPPIAPSVKGAFQSDLIKRSSGTVKSVGKDFSFSSKLESRKKSSKLETRNYGNDIGDRKRKATSFKGSVGYVQNRAYDIVEKKPSQVRTLINSRPSFKDMVVINEVLSKPKWSE